MNNGMGRLTKICHGSTRVLTRKSSTADLTAWRDSIHKMNKSVNALVHLKTPPLHGNEAKATPQALQDVAVCVKDNICTLDMPTTCSSAMLRHFKSPFDATVVRLLKQAGADIVGKTNCDEFGMGSLNKHSIHGPVVNPFQAPSEQVSWEGRERRSAGGSSGGSAAAVASGMCYAALATDTGGSTRLPASYCGIVGLKPSYGLISRWGVVSFADSLDCVGVMAQDVRSTKRVFDVLCVYDEKDPTAARPETRQTAFQSCQTRLSEWKMEQGNLTGLRIGVPQEYFPSELDPSVLTPIRHVLQNLKAQGACLVPVSLPSTSYALSAYYVISSAEASSNLARYDGVQYGAQEEIPPGADRTKTAKVYAHTRSAKLGSEVQKRILLGTYALTADAFDNYFLQSQRVRNVIRDDFNSIFHAASALSSSHRTPSSARPAGVDVLIHPSAIRTAPKLSESNDGLDAYVQDVLTVPASLAGLPALSVPAGFGEDGWPVGVSVVGQWGCEEMVLKVGEIIEGF